MVRNIVKNFCLYLIIIISITGCSDNQNVDITKMYKVYGNEIADVPGMLNDLSQKSIYFGHQSVGKNILSGIDYWNTEGIDQISIIES